MVSRRRLDYIGLNPMLRRKVIEVTIWGNYRRWGRANDVKSESIATVARCEKHAPTHAILQTHEADKMISCVRNLGTLLLLLVLMEGFHAYAQVDELLPEVDAYYKTNLGPRIWFQAKETREGGDPTTAEIGPSIEFYMKRWIKLKNVSAFDLDDAKARPILFSVGYRYLPYPDAAPKNRLEPFVTFNFPVWGKLLFSDKNRSDFDWRSGSFTWEYRNRVQFERTVSVHRYHLSPYASAEVFYQHQYKKWSDTAIYVGCLFPVGKRIEFDPYYEHQNNTGKRPNQQLNQFGLVLDLHF